MKQIYEGTVVEAGDAQASNLYSMPVGALPNVQEFPQITHRDNLTQNLEVAQPGESLSATLSEYSTLASPR